MTGMRSILLVLMLGIGGCSVTVSALNLDRHESEPERYVVPNHPLHREIAGNEYGWQLIRDEAQGCYDCLELYKNRAMIGRYDLAGYHFCPPEVGDDDIDECYNIGITIFARPPFDRQPLFVVSTLYGAHSRALLLIDPSRNAEKPIARFMGAYMLDYSFEDGQISIRYDDDCDREIPCMKEVLWRPEGEQR